jgi:hypothetical protein
MAVARSVELLKGFACDEVQVVEVAKVHDVQVDAVERCDQSPSRSAHANLDVRDRAGFGG